MKVRVFLIFFSICVLFAWQPGKARAESEKNIHSLMLMSLEDLSNIEVTSVSRKPENKFRAPAAITVLTTDDIRRSGATNIAEALRMVPGLNVARIDSNKWAITARGFNRPFSNKLQVQIDGRSVYTPLFSGVYWDVQDLLLDDIERIEIIRGPGATMWGANAVNGIINVITKNAEFTQGKHFTTLHGNKDRAITEARYGGRHDDNKFYRIYSKYVNRNEERKVDEGGNDDEWSQRRLGFRMDWHKSSYNKFKIQGDAYSGKEEQTHFLPGVITTGISSPVNGDEIYSGANILANWSSVHSNDSISNTRFYVDYISRKTTNILHQKRLTFDLDYQNQITLNDRNELIWGVGYRFFKDWIDEYTLSNGEQYLNYEPEKSYNSLLSAFIQNEYKVVPDKLSLILGSKLSHNYFTDFEVQPNVRLAWYPTENQTFWAAVSRAIRIPTRGERGLSSIALSTGSGYVRQSARAERDYDSEKLLAFELGHRVNPVSWLSLDTALFYNEYKELRTFETGVSGFNTPNTLFELVASNSGFAETYGGEVAANVTVNQNWRLFASYSFLEMQTHTLKGSDDFLIAAKEGQSPEHQFNLTSRYNLNDSWEIDHNLYYVDQLPAYDVDDYVRLDMRVSWKPFDGTEVSLVGQNLIDDHHQETKPALYTRPAEIGRNFYLKMTIDF